MKIIVYGIRGFPDVQGGVERHCEELYPKIASEHNQITVLRRSNYVRSNKKYDWIHFYDFKSIKSRYLEAFIHSLIACFVCIFRKPDIVHIHNIGPAFTLPLLKLRGIKTVVTYHSSNYEHKKWNRLGKLFLKMSEKFVFLLADKIIFVSKSKYNQFPLEKGTFIPNGITEFKETENQTNYNVECKKYILGVGRIVPEKRWKDLIEAFQCIKTEYKLIIAGGFDNSSFEYNRIKKSMNDRILLTGQLSSKQLSSLYKNAYCFVLPSENEGMPIVLLEAMSFGLCPLVSDIKENLDVIENMAYSFQTKNIHDLKRKLEYMLQNPNEIDRQGKNCETLVNSKYSWEKIAKLTLRNYNAI